MAFVIDEPGDNPGTGSPGDPGYVPPTTSGTKIAVVITGTSFNFAGDQMRAAGGPWPSFTVRVTPLNAAGSGGYAEEACSVSGDTDYDGGGA